MGDVKEVQEMLTEQQIVKEMADQSQTVDSSQEEGSHLDDIPDDLLVEISRVEAPPKMPINTPPGPEIVEAADVPSSVPSSQKPQVGQAPEAPIIEKTKESVGVEKANGPETKTQAPAPVPAEKIPSQEELFQQMHQKLVKEYALTEEEAIRYLAEGEQVLPSMLARVHAKAVLDAMNTFTHSLPRMLEVMRKEEDRVNRARQEFFEQVPFLKPYENSPILGQVAHLVAQTEPNLSQAEFTRKVGLMAAAYLGVQVPSDLVQNSVSTSPTVQSPAIVRKGGGMAPTGGSRGGNSRHNVNVFTELSKEFEFEEDE